VREAFEMLSIGRTSLSCSISNKPHNITKETSQSLP
jgi:hypothetical protein